MGGAMNSTAEGPAPAVSGRESLGLRTLARQTAISKSIERSVALRAERYFYSIPTNCAAEKTLKNKPIVDPIRSPAGAASDGRRRALSRIQKKSAHVHVVAFFFSLPPISAPAAHMCRHDTQGVQGGGNFALLPSPRLAFCLKWAGPRKMIDKKPGVGKHHTRRVSAWSVCVWTIKLRIRVEGKKNFPPPDLFVQWWRLEPPATVCCPAIRLRQRSARLEVVPIQKRGFSFQIEAWQKILPEAYV